MEPNICIRCTTQSCTRSGTNEVDVCEWGVAYFNTGTSIYKKETLVPLRYLSQNLRHEVHRVLGLIVKEVNDLNPSLTTRYPDISHPTGRILGATLIIDQFLQMVAGVHDFHPSHSISMSGNKLHLPEIVRKYFNVYSLIRNTRRTKGLTLNAIDCEAIESSLASDCLEYIIAVLIDNAWKYSTDNSALKVTATSLGDGFADIIFQNVSRPIPNQVDIFERGLQTDNHSDGFGFGLFWAKTLTEFYNELRGGNLPHTEIIHTQTIVGEDLAEQVFTIKNVICEIGEKTT